MPLLIAVTESTLVLTEALSASSSINSIGRSIFFVTLLVLYNFNQRSSFSRTLLFFLSTKITGALMVFSCPTIFFAVAALKSLVVDVTAHPLVLGSIAPTPT